MVNIYSKVDETKGIKLPTSLNEITPDVLKSIVDGIKIPKHYCIIAMAFKTKVFDFISTIATKKDYPVSVTNILAYIDDEDKNTINANVADKIVIDRSSIERGNQLTINISATVDNARKFFSSDNELVRSIMSGKNSDITISDSVILLNFKIVPIVDIKAAIAPNRIQINPFVLTKANINN